MATSGSVNSDEEKNESSSWLGSTLQSREQSTGMADEHCDTYIIMTIAAMLTMLFQFVLLGIAVYYIITKMNPNMKMRGQKRNGGILKKVKDIIIDLPLQWLSSSQVILVENNHHSDHIQPDIKVEEGNQTDAQPNTTSESRKTVYKESSPMPPHSAIGLPPLPPSQDQFSRKSFGSSDGDHEYDYIRLPININQQQKAEWKDDDPVYEIITPQKAEER